MDLKAYVIELLGAGFPEKPNGPGLTASRTTAPPLTERGGTPDPSPAAAHSTVAPPPGAGTKGAGADAA